MHASSRFMLPFRCGGIRPAWLLVAASVVAGPHPVASAEQPPDRVRLSSGSELQGEIIDVSPNSLDLEETAGETKKVRKVAIEEIREVRFGGEPESLRDARGLLARRDGPGALDELGKIPAADIDQADDEIKAEVAFVRAAATACRALATGDGLPAAQKAVADQVAANPRSLHLYALQELLGDLYAAQGRPIEAAAAYETLDRGPPAIAVRAATLRADLLARQGKFAEAQRVYETAAAAAAGITGEAGVRAARQARLGSARCLIRQGKAGDAVQAVTALLAATDDDSLGRAYNVLGEAHRAVPGREQDALIAFLTVDLVHNDVPEDHAEALFNLVELWEKVNFPERAREARQTLETTYPDSPWTRKLAAAKAS